jgi:hypothetical protein
MYASSIASMFVASRACLLACQVHHYIRKTYAEQLEEACTLAKAQKNNNKMKKNKNNTKNNNNDMDGLIQMKKPKPGCDQRQNAAKHRRGGQARASQVGLSDRCKGKAKPGQGRAKVSASWQRNNAYACRCMRVYESSIASMFVASRACLLACQVHHYIRKTSAEQVEEACTLARAKKKNNNKMQKQKKKKNKNNMDRPNLMKKPKPRCDQRQNAAKHRRGGQARASQVGLSDRCKGKAKPSQGRAKAEPRLRRVGRGTMHMHAFACECKHRALPACLMQVGHVCSLAKCITT